MYDPRRGDHCGGYGELDGAARARARPLCSSQHLSHRRSSRVAVETFLRTAVFPLSSRRDKFFHLVDNLGKTGIDQLSIDRLHALRGLYNDSKHDPGKPLLLAGAIETIETAVAALQTICARNIGITGAPSAASLPTTSGSASGIITLAA
jgi:hypothetical protein